VRVRPFEARDFAGVVALMQQTLALPAFDERVLTRDFLLAPGFRPEHLLVAEEGSTLAGFMLAPRHDPLGAPTTGWIAALGVAPKYRRRGVATGLLSLVFADMRREDFTQVDVADVPVRYLLPGVDRAAYPGAAELLIDYLGFSLREEVASMGIELDRDFPIASEARPVTLGELPLIRDFFDGWGPGWWEHIERSALLKLAGDSVPSEILAWWEDGKPLGVAHFRGHRFGPLAVAEAARGHGIGAALTLATLAAMKSSGFADAYFLVGREEVQPFYTRLGFTVLRRFEKLTLKL